MTSSVEKCSVDTDDVRHVRRARNHGSSAPGHARDVVGSSSDHFVVARRAIRRLDARNADGPSVAGSKIARTKGPSGARMKFRHWLYRAALLTVASCGGSTSGSFPGGDASVGTPCGVTGSACQSGSQCCSATCDPNGTCASTIGRCVAAGGTCASGTDCCSLSCSGGVCGGSCVSDNQPCTGSGSCCSGTCSNGACQPMNNSCKTAGNACGGNDECCSKFCSGGTCALTPGWCIQTGDICSNPVDCCGGICDVAPGSTLGKCSPPPSGATYCNGGVDGTVCDACNGCCSRLCAPYPTTGVKICQPASGCHVNGDLCRKTSDCCGAPGTGLPGDGNVVCEIAPGQAIG